MDISIIIPSYKPKSYIYECLDSLVNQTLSKDLWEVVLILNGCNEPFYSNILNRYSHLLPNLKLIQTDSPGVSNARNIGLTNSIGEYITFIDDDDFVSSNYLEQLYKNSSSKGITISNILSFKDNENDYIFEEINRTEKIRLLSKIGNINVYQARKLLNGPWIKLVHRSIIENVKYNTRLKNGEDAVFMFEISKNIKEIKFTNQSAIYFIRQRIDSASKKQKPLYYWIKTAISMDWIMTVAYITHINKYDCRLFFNRLIAPWKKVLRELLIK